jgi:uncharacterized membrane protein YgcG
MNRVYRPRAWPAAVWVGIFVTASAHSAERVALANVRALDIHYDVDSVLAAAESGAPFELDCGTQSFLIEAAPAELRAPTFRASARGRSGAVSVIPPRASLFTGRVLGAESSIVRLSFTRDGLFAWVYADGDEYYIEPARGLAFSDRNPRLHKAVPASDLLFAGTCAAADDVPALVEPLSEAPGAASSASPADGAAEAGVAEAGLAVLQLAIEADFEYVVAHGDNTVPSIEAVLNVVDGIFQAELGLTIEISSVEFHEDDTDAYTATDALTLLQEMQRHWNGNKAGIQRDAAHLFTGRELDGTTVGIAFVAEVCDLGGAYGVSQDLPSTSMMPLLVAHELGHNLGAFHDPSDDPQRFIMNPVLSGSTLSEYSALSKADIGDFVSRIRCLSPAPADTDGDGGSGGDGGGGDVGGGGSGSGGGGGGGGPVDPLTLALAAAMLAATRRGVRGRGRER